MSSVDYSPIKVEDQVGKPLSPYAATKAMDEMYAAVFALTYGLSAVGLRYFNVFGPRQDPNGPYAAVIEYVLAARRRHNPPARTPTLHEKNNAWLPSLRASACAAHKAASPAGETGDGK